MALIYMVEDEANIRELVVYTLNASGFNAVGYADADSFEAAMPTPKPDLILLDIMLPGKSGLDILRKLRGNKETQQIPVMMLTAKDSEYDKVIGLEAGADDYLAKPFGMMEMVARVKALLRRSEYGTADAVAKPLSVGAVSLFPNKHSVEVNGGKVKLTLKEYELLLVLMEHPGVVFTRDQLLERIWGYSYEGETRTVDVHVRLLRQKLGEAADCIETVRGVGYRLGEEKS